MQVTEQYPFAEVIPRTSRNILRPTAPVRKRHKQADPTEQAEAMSFSHLLTERQERPELKPAAKPGTTTDDKPAGTQAATGLAQKAVVDPGKSGKSVVADSVELAGVATEPTDGIVAGAGGTLAAAQGVAGTAVLPAQGAGAGTAEDTLAPAATTLPAAAAEATAGKIASVTVATEAGEKTAAPAAVVVTPTPEAALPDEAASQKDAVLPNKTVLPNTTALPNEPIASKQPAPPTTTTQTGTEAAALQNQDQPQVQAPSAASAQTLQTTVQGQDAYAKAPVVSEAQMVADSLKLEHKVTAADSTKVLGAPAALAQTGPALTAAADSAPTDSGQEQEAAPSDVAAAEREAAEDTSPAVTTETTSQSAVPAQSDANTKPVKPETDDTLETAAAAAATAAVDSSSEQNHQTAVMKASPGAAAGGTVSRQVHQQVVSHLASNLSSVSGQEKITIKLNPESLGQIELSFEGRDDKLSVVIAATTPEADAALRENIKDLTDRIVERSSRFSQVEVRVEIRENSAARQDGKPDQKQDGRQDSRRDQNGQEDQDSQHEQTDQHSRQAQQARLSWENAMSWHLADQAASEEG